MIKNREKTGRTMVRGCMMEEGDYHLTVEVWIRNSKWQYLISKRTPNKTYPNMWATTGGAAVSGDGSLETALKETQEELGISLNPENGILIKSIRRELPGRNSFKDIWLFCEDVDIGQVIHQEDEVADSMWATSGEIKDMIHEGDFIDVSAYMDEVINT